MLNYDLSDHLIFIMKHLASDRAENVFSLGVVVYPVTHSTNPKTIQNHPEHQHLPQKCWLVYNKMLYTTNITL